MPIMVSFVIQKSNCMKTTFFTLIAVIFSFASYAQPILTGANMNPRPGDIFYGHGLDTNLAAGPSGANVTWNFASVTETGLDTTVYVACDSTPYCDSFPGSNIAQSAGSDIYQYYNTSATKFSKIGEHYPGSNLLYTKTQELLQYPLTYNNVFVDTAAYAYAGIGWMHTQIDSYKCDGYGTLILPTGTDTGVVRIRVSTTSIDSNAFSGITRTWALYYLWYKPGFHNPIMGIGYDTVGSATGSLFIAGAEYWVKNYNPASVPGINTNPFAMKAFPNPASDNLHISFTLPGSATAAITVTDMLGRVVATVSGKEIVSGANTVVLPVSSFPSGSYIVRLQGSAGSVSQQVTINR